MLEITIKGEPKEIIDFFDTLDENKDVRLIRQVAPLVAKRISLYDIIKSESLTRNCDIAELVAGIINHLKAEQGK